MGSQTSIGWGVIGVLLILFLAILYSRFFGSEQPTLQIPTESSPGATAPLTIPESSYPQLSQPTIVSSDNNLPQEAYNPPVPWPADPELPTIGPSPRALIPDESQTPPPEFEARQREARPAGSVLDPGRFLIRE